MRDNKIQPITLIKSTFYDELSTKKRLADFIIQSARLSMGETCTQFEASFSAYHERKSTTLFNSGSSANLALIQSLINLGSLKKGDKVAFSALTWATNVMPLIQLGLTPIPVDINISTLNISSKNFLTSLTDNPDIKALFITNILGFCDDIDNILNICHQKNIILIEDNCESFGSVYRGKKLGNFGLASTFSTFVGHHLSTIEGGMVLTDDGDLDRMLRMVRAHGWDRSISEHDKQKIRKVNNVDPFYDLYTFYDLAYNLRPTELTGFLGNIQLEKADQIIHIRQNNFKIFDEAASNNKDFLLIRGDNMEVVSNFAYPVICTSKNNFLYYREKCINAGLEIRPLVGGGATLDFLRILLVA